MDARFQVTDPPRETLPGVSPETPVIALAWRALHAGYQRRAEELKGIAAEDERISRMLVEVADEAHRLRKVLRELSEGDAAVKHLLERTADRLTGSLTQLGVLVHAPEGQLYGDALMELFDNVAQRLDADTPVPRVAEVVTPAVTRNGVPIRTGKAVIGVPAVPERRD